MIRRAVAVLGLAMVAVVGPTAAATAEPTPAPTPTAAPSPTPSPAPSAKSTGAPGVHQTLEQQIEQDRQQREAIERNRANSRAATDCKRPPVPGGPHDGLAGLLDEGPATPGGGYYSRYGFGGFAPVIYDPGCPVNVMYLPAGAAAAQKRIWDGPNAVTDALMQGMLIATAVAVQGTRLVLGGSSWWGLFDHIGGFVQVTLAARLWLAFGVFALSATGLYWVLRAPRGEVKESASASARGVIILATAGACMAWSLSVGALIDQGAQAVYSATADVTAGEAVSPDVATGDALLGNVVYPVWSLIHFGTNTEAAETYGPRLFAAGAFTRDEQAAIAANPALEQAKVREKKANYRAVAAEIEKAAPSAYEHLAGASTSARPGYALFGAVGVAAVVFTLGVSLWWIALLKVGVRLIVAAWPALALLTQFPTLQFIAANLGRIVQRFAVTAAVMLAVYVAFMVGGVGAILNSPFPLAARIAALTVLVLVGRYVWQHRGELIYRRTGAEESREEMRRGFQALRGQLRARKPEARGQGKPFTQHAASAARVAAAAVQRRPVKLAAEVAAAVPKKKPATRTTGEDRSRPRRLTPQDWPTGLHTPREANPAPGRPLPMLGADELARHTASATRKETSNAFPTRNGG